MVAVASVDECAAAQLVCTPVTYYGTTGGATNDGSCSCGSAATSPDVWYYFMPYGGGALTLMLMGSSFDTVLSVHSGCPGTVENELACNDDYLSPQSRVDVFVADHQEYWIRVAGKDGVTGDFQLTVAGPECIWDPECNDNGIPDECEPDCNDNGEPDDCDIADGTSLDENGNGIPDECEGSLLGDLNCDEAVNSFDIDPFVLALSDPGAYATAWPDCDINNADCNEDGEINTFDIDPFVDLLTGG